jgi:hypothetical protein
LRSGTAGSTFATKEGRLERPALGKAMKFDSAWGPGYQFFRERFQPCVPEADVDAILMRELPADQGIVEHLLRVPAGTYDPKAAIVLSAASAWAYAEADTMTRVMRNRGIPNNRSASLAVSNDALFVDTDAHLVQSEDGKLVILCFRGTQPRNTIDWLTDLSARMDPFFAVGDVHGGFARAILALWPCIRVLLNGALRGYSVCDMTQFDRLVHRCPMEDVMPKPSACGASPWARTEGMDGLYITGHSFGGALAVLAAAAIAVDPDLAPVKGKLRGIYTFGQPMVGGKGFAGRFGHEVGDMLFRHVYKRDIVPRLPPLTMGNFQHIGQEYQSTEAGWVAEPGTVNQLVTGILSNLAGVLAWVDDQFPLLSWVPTYVSWGQHSPLNYVRTSMESPPGSELF